MPILAGSIFEASSAGTMIRREAHSTSRRWTPSTGSAAHCRSTAIGSPSARGAMTASPMVFPIRGRCICSALPTGRLAELCARRRSAPATPVARPSLSRWMHSICSAPRSRWTATGWPWARVRMTGRATRRRIPARCICSPLPMKRSMAAVWWEPSVQAIARPSGWIWQRPLRPRSCRSAAAIVSAQPCRSTATGWRSARRMMTDRSMGWAIPVRSICSPLPMPILAAPRCRPPSAMAMSAARTCGRPRSARATSSALRCRSMATGSQWEPRAMMVPLMPSRMRARSICSVLPIRSSAVGYWRELRV